MGNQPSNAGADPRELAALYISGALSFEERARVDHRIESGEAALTHAIRELEMVADLLGRDAPSIEPNPATKHMLLAFARRSRAPGPPRDNGSPEDAQAKQVWRQWETDTLDNELFTLFAGEGGWEDTGVEGITVRRLFVDRTNNRMTAMFRMAPGAAYVPHVHDGPEECYVLQGDLHVGDDLVMHAGDYQRAPKGSVHGIQRTENGCLLLITSSLDDELI